MTREKLIALPNPSLRKASKIVEDVSSNKIKSLIKEMESVTLDWESSRKHETGVALAAIQINQPLRVVIVRKDFADRGIHDFDVYINPKITRYEGEPEFELEGCLSVKDIYGKVPRYPKIKIKAINQDGTPIKMVLKGFKARVFQHEIDHTDGKTFIDRVGNDGEFYLLQETGEMKQLSKSDRHKFLEDSGYVPKE